LIDCSIKSKLCTSCPHQSTSLTNDRSAKAFSWATYALCALPQKYRVFIRLIRDDCWWSGIRCLL